MASVYHKKKAWFEKEIWNVVCITILIGVRAGICKGDSGSPLFTVRKPYMLVGIVSWGAECADAFFPGVYTRVASFSEFIRSMSQWSRLQE